MRTPFHAESEATKETPEEKAQAKANKAAAKAVAKCPVCGYELHADTVTHCDHCGHDYTLAAGEKCPNPNCGGVLA